MSTLYSVNKVGADDVPNRWDEKTGSTANSSLSFIWWANSNEKAPSHVYLPDEQPWQFQTKFSRVLASTKPQLLLRKINVLKRYGISGTDLTKFISSNPSLFQAGDTETIPSFDFLRSLVKTDENIVTIVRRASRIHQSNLEKTIGPNIAIIRSHGDLIQTL
ncbi:Mitochodrial transcription termination factor-related [Cinnamomum micranthum f. kanehirae]|uniref:Mitochodrial transcription termination factor-related n=1 Tax=Cinnamomum micranthum f. kanehirae TaxID=337451 RepID=A0A443NJZ7_9MAGN|nr:Mitochodrial transcription termination factor-related [Cinnamomum micranthum f. kanehirae]